MSQEDHHLSPTKMTEHEHKNVTTTTKVTSPTHATRGRYSYYRGRAGTRALSTFLLVLLLILGITFLTLWLVYRPYKPKFRVVSASIYNLNTTFSPPFMISTTLQFTVVTRNPNKRVSFHYDQLVAFVSYKNLQPITPQITLPAPFVHEPKTTVGLSPVLGGSGVPVTDEVVNGLGMDQDRYGVVGLRLVITGTIRYKAGIVVRRGRHGVYVRCDMFVGMKRGVVGQLPLLGASDCIVDA